MLESVPPKLRPAVGGALLFGGVVILRAVFAAPRIAQSGLGIESLALAVLVAAAAGAVGGLTYSFFGERLVDIPTIGPYLMGIVSVSAYMVAVLLGLAALGESLVHNGRDMVIVVVVTLIMGLAAGSGWKSGRPR